MYIFFYNEEPMRNSLLTVVVVSVLYYWIFKNFPKNSWLGGSNQLNEEKILFLGKVSSEIDSA